MAEKNLVVDGHSFSTRTDYEAAQRDKAKINRVRRETDFTDQEALQRLLKQMSQGNLRFESVLGREFDDEVFETIEQLKAGKGKEGRTSPADRNRRVPAVSLEDCDEALKQQIVRELAKREKRRRLITVLCAFVAVASIGYFLFYQFLAQRTDRASEQLAALKSSGDGNVTVHINKSNEESTEKEILEEYKKIYNLNKKLIGWIKIDDTVIDYPVLQTGNNEYYLDHNSDQEYDKNGSIFMDYQCDAQNRSTNLIVYGHNMKSGKMFGSLKNYQKKAYFEKHPLIRFDTIYEKGVYQIMYVFRSHVYSEEEITFKYYQFIDAVSEEEFYSNMTEMSKMSFYDTEVTAEYGDELLTLSTCDSNESNGRFVVVAKKIQ